jgi:hypothetical protein
MATCAPQTRARVENDDHAAFARGIVAAHGRRIAAGDVERLRDLVDLATEIERDRRDRSTDRRLLLDRDRGHSVSPAKLRNNDGQCGRRVASAIARIADALRWILPGTGVDYTLEIEGRVVSVPETSGGA